MISEHLTHDFLDDLTAGLRVALREDLVAVYLYGSAAAGGFDPDVSDIDLLVVTAHTLDAPAVRRLGTLHRRTVQRRPEWDNRLELVLSATRFGRSATRRRRTSPRNIVTSSAMATCGPGPPSTPTRS